PGSAAQDRYECGRHRTVRRAGDADCAQRRDRPVHAEPDCPARRDTFPDGNIYSLPTIYDPDFDALNMQTKMWVRQDWLDQFGMDPPSTLEEFEAYLVEVKNGDPNGNGEADEIPYSAGNPDQFVQ